MLPEVKVKPVRSSIPEEQSERVLFEVFDFLLAGDFVAELDKEAKTLKRRKEISNENNRNTNNSN